MTTRRKSKRQNDSSPIDEKEHADRIAAAEAMSCLSSMVVLPSNAEELLSLGADILVSSKKSAQNSTKNAVKSATSTANKKGKTRTRSTKKSPSSSNKKSPVSSGADSASNDKVKQKTPKYAPTLAGKRQNKLPDQVLSLTINPRNPNHDFKKATDLATETDTLTSEDKKPKTEIDVKSPGPSISSPLCFQVNSLASEQCAIEIDHNKPGKGLYNLSDSDLHKLLSGKIPFQVKSGSADGYNLFSNQVNVGTSSRIELSQAAVNSILTSMALKQKLESQSKDLAASGSTLPLKKRRLQGYQDGNTNNDNDEKPVESEAAKPGGSVLVPSAERVNPVSVDPTTSLLLLNEIQVALQQDDDGDLPLHIAVVHENIVMVQKFVHLMSISGKSVDKYNKAQQTPLHLSVELNFIPAVQTLLLAGANPNLVNKNGENCVHMAIKSSSLECLNLLLQSSDKLDINARNFDGLAPIHVAVMKNDIDIVKFMLSLKADINIQDGKSGRTPLFYAVEGNNVPLVEMLQKAGANLDLPNYASVTAVMAAQARGFHEIASMLLKCMDSKAYLEMKEKERGTPLKKVPIPRIPSKSHLIQGTESKPTVVDLQNFANSDSDDSVKSNMNLGRKRNLNPEKGKHKAIIKQEKRENAIKLPEIEPDDKDIIEEERRAVEAVEKELQQEQKENQEEQPQTENQEAILIPRQLLERLQSTMLSLLAMQKLPQGVTSNDHVTVSVNNSVPVQKTSGVNVSSAIQNTVNLKLLQNHATDNDHVSQHKSVDTKNIQDQNLGIGSSQRQPTDATSAKPVSLSSLTSHFQESNHMTSQIQPVNLSSLSALSQHSNNRPSPTQAVNLSAFSTAGQDSHNGTPQTQAVNLSSFITHSQPPKSGMAQVQPMNLSSVPLLLPAPTNHNLGASTSNPSKPTDTSLIRYKKDLSMSNNTSGTETPKQTLAKGSEKTREKKDKHTVLQHLLNAKKGSEKISQKRRISMDNSRMEEPMEVSESGSFSELSSQTSTKPGKTPGVGHAAMNQLGRETSVSSSLQATLLQMLRSKQMNKPLNLSTSKDNNS